MPTKMDLTGQRFGRLLVLAEAPPFVTPGGHLFRRWTCKCDCGVKTEPFQNALRAGETNSCGCRKREMLAERCRKHGRSESQLYKAWRAMLDRCKNQNHESYVNYGGRGITVCDRWHSFENFLADMGERPPGMSIERRDNDGNYEPGNCYWATRDQQQSNKRTTRLVEWSGVTKPLYQWAREFNTSGPVILNRLQKTGSPFPMRPSKT